MDFWAFMTWFGFILWVISLFSRIAQIIPALSRWVSFEEAIELQGEAKILFRLARPISLLRKTLRFGFSYWFNLWVKANYILKFVPVEGGYRFELRDGEYIFCYGKPIKVFPTLMECKIMLNSSLHTPKIIKEYSENGIIIRYIYAKKRVWDRLAKFISWLPDRQVVTRYF